MFQIRRVTDGQCAGPAGGQVLNHGKPIVVVTGITPGTEPGDDEQMIVAYEREGVNGKRMTVDIRGTVVIVSAGDFAQIKFAGGHQPAGR